jgi:hypothetical protein
VAAPLAVRVTVPATHIAVGLATAVMVGVGFTTNMTVEEEEHIPVVPVTVYVEVTVGLTTTLVPVIEPGIQV